MREFFAANVSFHELLCELSGNPKLQEVHHRLEGEIGRFQNRTLALRGSMDDSLTEHRAILAAIRLRDADRAAELTADHIRVPAQRLQAALDDDARRRIRRGRIRRVRRVTGGAGFGAGGAVAWLTSRLRGRARSSPCPISAPRCASTGTSSALTRGGPYVHSATLIPNLG